MTSPSQPLPQAWTPAFAYLRVEDPLIAWLVYRGDLVSSTAVGETAVSVWAAGYLHEASAIGSSERYKGELVLEQLRAARHPAVASRLRCLYLFPDRESAVEAPRRWGGGGTFRPEFLAEVGIRPGSAISRHDAEWITHHLGSGSSPEWMDTYLDGQPSGDSPIWELLVDGRAVVLGTDLRKAAYEVVKATWPGSLALLELARIGTWVDSDLGLISAFAIREGDEIVIKYAINMVGANDPELLERAFAPDVEKNWNDLTPESDLVTPDLRSREFRFPAL